MPAIDDGTARVCAELGLDPLTAEDQALVLDLARDVAHGVLRPAAPVTAYLLGLAVGRGAGREAATVLQELAKTWPGERPATKPEPGPTTQA